MLLEFATYASGAELERILRRFAGVEDAMAKNAMEPYERRSLNSQVGNDGMVPVADDSGRALPAMSVRSLRRLGCDAPVRFVARDDDIDPYDRIVWQPPPLQARTDGETPDCDACVEVLAHHLHRHREPDPVRVAA